MQLDQLLVILLVGAIAGWLAGLVMRGRGLGLLGNIVVGILGAFVGAWLFGLVGLVLPFSGLAEDIFQAFVGAVILLLILGALKKA